MGNFSRDRDSWQVISVEWLILGVEWGILGVEWIRESEGFKKKAKTRTLQKAEDAAPDLTPSAIIRFKEFIDSLSNGPATSGLPDVCPMFSQVIATE